MHVTLRRIDETRWCAVDARFPTNDARSLVGYVERVGRGYHALRLDGPVSAYEEPDLNSVLRDLETPRAGADPAHGAL
ncbi:hypothetical protein ACX9R5_05525 [Rathayibacter sp. CAU 1779]